MASKKNVQNPAVEVAGIILIGFSIFLSCCLFTYYPDDPSFITGYSQIPEKIINLGGLVGAYVSSWLFQMLGLGAYIIPVSIFLLAIKILFKPDFPYIF